VSDAAQDPFDTCDACGHTRRCHDSRGCGKWLEAQLVNDWRCDEDGYYGVPVVSIMPAHTCPCSGFKDGEP